MTPQKQYNDYACAAAALTSFLIDATGTPIKQKEDVVKKSYSHGNPFLVGTALEGAIPMVNPTHNQAVSLAILKNLDPARFVSDVEYWKDFLQDLTQKEFRLIKPRLDDLRIVVETHGAQIMGVNYLPTVAKVGELPPNETYLVITNVLGPRREAHVMRWQGVGSHNRGSETVRISQNR